MISQKFYFEEIPSILIILLPVFLITGPFLSDLAISLVALIFLINSYFNKLKKFYNNIFFKIFIIFWLILITSSLLSDNILISLKNSFFYFRFAIFSLCFWYLIELNEKILRFLFISILISFSILIFDGYFQYIFNKNLLGWELYNTYRVSSFFGSELILGSYLSRLFPILFGLFVFLDRKNKTKKLLFFVTIIFILSEGLIFLSGERLALFFMNLSAVFIILMIKDYRKYRFWTYIVSLCLIFALLIVFPNSKDRLIDQTINDFTRDSDQIYIFSKPHNDMYIAGYRMFLDNKFFGVGTRQFRNECEKYPVSEYSCSTHPHNTYVELLSETGIFSFLIVFGLFILIIFLCVKQFIYKLLKLEKEYFNDFEICIISALLISLWPFSPSGSFFNNWMSIVYFFPVGMLLWQINLKKSLKSNK
ncbi:O-antigen ligase family protein [Candidatus Pelagibacter sp.]|nr:O-antigen ligase family protein [Candidatus Pelagibacter sp.]